jgi:hypothetical protein
MVKGDLCYNLTRMTIGSPERIAQFNILMELSALINSSLDVTEIRKRTIEAAVRLVDAETGSLLFLDDETGNLFFDVALGEKGESIKTIRLKKGQGIAGWVAEHQEPVIARIISVADTFDAMTTDRPYRKGLSVEAALEELRRYAGTQFDPDAVNAFIRYYDEGNCRSWE